MKFQLISSSTHKKKESDFSKPKVKKRILILENVTSRLKIYAPAGNQTRVWSVAGTYTITVLLALDWSIWVSIPVPRACKARALPIAPIPLDVCVCLQKDYIYYTRLPGWTSGDQNCSSNFFIFKCVN